MRNVHYFLWGKNSKGEKRCEGREVHPHFTLDELLSMPALKELHTESVKHKYTLDGIEYQQQLSRANVKDGAEYANQVTILRLHNGVCEVFARYQAE